MSDVSSIEWTDATWNPVRGCSIVSPGCTHCYAMKHAHRFSGAGQAYEGLTTLTKGGPVWTGQVLLVPELLDWPLRKRKPLRIFVNSMSDLFHEDVPDEFIDNVFAMMALAREHTFQILTKRPLRMREYLNERSEDPAAYLVEASGSFGGDVFAEGPFDNLLWPLPNVWLGVSVEDQARADERIPLLLQTSAAVRFVSAEPLLGPVDLDTRKMFPPSEAFAPPPKLDWVIVGGESGPGARPCSVDWIRSVVKQCRAAGTACFVKQLGSRPTVTEAVLGEWGPGVRFTGDSPGTNRGRALLVDGKGANPAEWPEALRVREFPS